MSLRSPIAVLIVAAATALADARSAGDRQAANTEIVRLEPGAFKALTADIRADLERRRCSIPQTYLNGGPHNVVRGRFTSARQMDIALLCSKGGMSSILVYPAGTVRGVHELARQPDAHNVQTIGAGISAYSRYLSVATPKSIRDHYEWYGGPKPPPLDHDGVDDAVVEKASVVWYWYRGRWLQLQGAD